MKCYLYVSLSREDKILIFAIDLQTGKLQAQGEMKVPGGPANMVFDPSQQFIYVGRKGDRSISLLIEEIVQQEKCRSPVLCLSNFNLTGWLSIGKVDF